MKTLIILIRTKNNQVTHELEKQIRDAVMPMADVVATGISITNPQWLGKQLKKRKHVLACIFDNHGTSDIFGSIGGPSSKLADALLSAEKGKTSWDVVSEYAAAKDEKYHSHLERYRKESPDGLLHPKLKYNGIK